MDKAKGKKKIVIAILVALFVVLGVWLLIFGGKRDDVVITEYSVSADGSEMTLKASVASSAGYLGKITVSYDDDAVLVDFYSTFGINNPIGAKSEFAVPLRSDSEIVCINRGDSYYAAFAKDDDGQWYRYAR